jgi:hypothetical protein
MRKDNFSINRFADNLHGVSLLLANLQFCTRLIWRISMHRTTPRPASKPLLSLLLVASVLALPTLAFAEKAYLEITLKVDPQDRPAAGAVYTKYKKPFLSKIPGAKSKELLIRDDDVQVLHGFATRKQAEAYLSSDMFTKDVVVGLKPLLKADPEVRIYTAD